MKKIDTSLIEVNTYSTSGGRDEPIETEFTETEPELNDIFINNAVLMLMEGEIDNLTLKNNQIIWTGSVFVNNQEGEPIEIDNPEFNEKDMNTIVFQYLCELYSINKTDKNFDISDNISEYIVETFIDKLETIPTEFRNQYEALIKDLQTSINNSQFGIDKSNSIANALLNKRTLLEVKSENEIEVFHLAHIDADGYGSSLVYDYNEQTGGKVFGESVRQTNKYYANYDYIGDMVEIIVNDIKKKPGKKLFLVTDLSLRGTDLDKPQNKLNKEEADQYSIDVLNRLVKDLEQYDCQIKVVDHHASGHNEANAFDWYRLDTSKSATLGMYDIVAPKNKHMSDIEDMALSIDNYDIYKEHNSEAFLKGSNYQALTMELMGIFPDTTNKNVSVQAAKRDYINFIFLELNRIFTNKEASIVELNMGLLTEIKKTYLKKILNEEDFKAIDNSNLTVAEKMKMAFYKRYNIEYKESFVEKMEEKMDETYSTPVEDKIKYASRILENRYINKSVSDFEKIEQYITSFVLSENAENSSLPEYEKIDNFIGTAIYSAIQIKIKQSLVIVEEFVESVYTDITNEFIIRTKNLKNNTPEELNKIKQSIISEIIEDLPDTDENISIKKAAREVELSNNTNIPYGMLASMIYGPEMIDNNTQTTIQVKNIDTTVSIVTDIKSTIYQHAVFEQSSYNLNSVFLKIDYERGSMSIRSKNGKANKIAAIFGGGGHPDAAGGFIHPSKVFSKEFLDNYKKMNRKEKEGQSDYMRNEYLKYISEQITIFDNEQLEKKSDTKKDI